MLMVARITMSQRTKCRNQRLLLRRLDCTVVTFVARCSCGCAIGRRRRLVVHAVIMTLPTTTITTSFLRCSFMSSERAIGDAHTHSNAHAISLARFVACAVFVCVCSMPCAGLSHPLDYYSRMKRAVTLIVMVETRHQSKILMSVFDTVLESKFIHAFLYHAYQYPHLSLGGNGKGMERKLW